MLWTPLGNKWGIIIVKVHCEGQGRNPGGNDLCWRDQGGQRKGRGGVSVGKGKFLKRRVYHEVVEVTPSGGR